MIRFLVLCLVAFGLCSFGNIGLTDVWGFYGHKKINRMAVFTLPADMMYLYKTNIEYITSHAVDPDRRRFAVEGEAIRHYIDLDHWGKTPLQDIPKRYSECILKFADYYIVSDKDSMLVRSVDHDKLPHELIINSGNYITYDNNDGVLLTTIDTLFYESSWSFPLDSLDEVVDSKLYQSNSSLVVIDRFSSFGIAPFQFVKSYKRLVKAFESKNLTYILRMSADIGHYVADMHVPLHTTENYNGQLTDQLGIHAFWESRLPELYADNEYDFFVGSAEYINNPRDFIWDIIEDTHSLLSDVLSIEKQLHDEFPSDLQYCYEDRNQQTVRTQCKDFANAYHDAMNGMVERQMQKAILAIGSTWLSAWVDAGQPDLKPFSNSYKLTEQEIRLEKELMDQINSGQIKGRKHIN